MSAEWSTSEIRRAASGQLTFTDEEAAAIRERAARISTLDSTNPESPVPHPWSLFPMFHAEFVQHPLVFAPLLFHGNARLQLCFGSVRLQPDRNQRTDGRRNPSVTLGSPSLGAGFSSSRAQRKS